MRTKVALAGVAIVTVSVIALAPFGASSSCAARSDGLTRCETMRHNLLSEQPGPVLTITAVVGALTLLAILAHWPWVRGGVAMLLTVAMVLGAASVGLFLLPLVAAAWLHAMSSGDPVRQT